MIYLDEHVNMYITLMRFQCLAGTNPGPILEIDGSDHDPERTSQIIWIRILY